MTDVAHAMVRVYATVVASVVSVSIECAEFLEAFRCAKAFRCVKFLSLWSFFTS
jgi:hypothetical protein